MTTPRKLPRPFEMHWGRGEIVEEASYVGEWHEPAIQLLAYTEGEAAEITNKCLCMNVEVSGHLVGCPVRALIEVDLSQKGP